MDSNQQPAVAFSHWVRWVERSSLDGVELPGVYLLAHFHTEPEGPADPAAEQVVYIGATDRPLVDRWQDFDRAIAGEAKNHSGGVTYRRHFSHRIEDLFVAALPVRLHKKLSWWFIQYVEAKLLWKFVWKWGSPPRCNI